jgi:hypothetical protein
MCWNAPPPHTPAYVRDPSRSVTFALKSAGINHSRAMRRCALCTPGEALTLTARPVLPGFSEAAKCGTSAGDGD